MQQSLAEQARRNGRLTEAWFEWGLDPSLETFRTTEAQVVGTGTVRAEDGPDSTWTLRLCANAALGLPADNNGAAYELMRRVQGLWPGLKLQVTPLPWARCLQDAEQGRFDGVLSASWTAERAARKARLEPEKKDEPAKPKEGKEKAAKK